MLKQFIFLIALSVAIIFAMAYAQVGVQWLLAAHDWISQTLTNVFSGGQAGNTTRGIIALLSIPLLVGLVPTMIYWMLRRHWFPYFMHIVWVVWLVQAGALVIMYNATTV